MNGVPNGPGEFLWPNGSTYKGMWKAGVREGFGLEHIVVADGTDVGIGSYKRDKKNGYCQVFYANGDWYHGYFLNNRKHGTGYYVFTDGHIEQGRYLNNKYQGKAVWR